MTNNSLSHSVLLESIDGDSPVDMIATCDGYLKELLPSIEDIQSRLECTEKDILVKTYTDGLFQKYADNQDVVSEHILKTENVSLEDLSKTARNTWDEMKKSQAKHRDELKEYARIITQGNQRTLERINMLLERAENIKHEPFKQELKFKNTKRFSIDGKFEPTTVDPILMQVNNLIAFYDKSLLLYIQSVADILRKLSFDEKWTDRAAQDFSKFNVKNWMKGAVPIKKDDRFRVSSTVYRSMPVQGNKTLFGAGPTETQTEEIRDWDFLVNTVRDFAFKFYTIPTMKDAPEGNNTFKVNDTSSIGRRLVLLSEMAKRIDARKDYATKLDFEFGRLMQLAETNRQQAGRIRAQQSNMRNRQAKVQDPDAPDGIPAISNIINSITLMINNVSRVVTDFSNALAGLVRVMGRLVFVTELELKAYQRPIQRPTQEQVNNPSQVR
ncbi:putative structural head protein [Pseudomonas phage KTN4]|uniref:Putative structural head protein n=1 Tax=Pseudomonas phage KTN4 TaxID=1862701 RepID=A0A192Y558_9CAUD|nr:putative structural head protein [Pseudomonas phage KTN4]